MSGLQVSILAIIISCVSICISAHAIIMERRNSREFAKSQQEHRIRIARLTPAPKDVP